MKTWLVLISMIFSQLTFADGNAGKQKASTCAACHGPEGISPNNLWPNLAGQKDQYILEQLKAFRDGTRVNAMMSPVAKMLQEQDMKDLADYFSQLKGSN